MEPSATRRGHGKLLHQGADATESDGVDPRQLTFGFADCQDEAVVSSAPVSRWAARVKAAGRVVRLPAGDRSLEEIRLEHAVAAYLPPGKSLRLTLTSNHYNIVAVRREPAAYAVRVHQIFSGAEPRLVRALARYVVHNDRRASGVIGEFIERHEKIISQAPRRPRQVKLRPAGRFHDLQDIFDRLNRRYFEGKLQARITWGPAAFRPQQRSIKMGSFTVEDRIIRVHPALDRPEVPSFFVDWIVFHEMLHGRHEIRRSGNRRCFHPPEFLAEEREFADYERASAWEKGNVDSLFRR
jgi:predicted metal-dependent hydrolase